MIQVGLSPIFYIVPFCGLMPFICHHNTKIAMEKRKPKQIGNECNDLQLIKPP
jgi:hypothetical protein